MWHATTKFFIGTVFADAHIRITSELTKDLLRGAGMTMFVEIENFIRTNTSAVKAEHLILTEAADYKRVNDEVKEIARVGGYEWQHFKIYNPNDQRVKQGSFPTLAKIAKYTIILSGDKTFRRQQSGKGTLSRRL